MALISFSRTRAHAQDFVLIRTYSFARLGRCARKLVLLMYQFSSVRIGKFWIQLSYFVSLAFLGSLAMMLLRPSNPDFRPRYVDMLFMSTSALTVSGLATVEMESLSSAQVLVLTFLMLVGGEAFVSLLGLLLRRSGERRLPNPSVSRVNSVEMDFDVPAVADAPTAVDVAHIESGLSNPVAVDYSSNPATKDLTLRSVRCLGYVVMVYILLMHVVGTLSLFTYASLVPTARDILKTKGINIFLFAFSTTVSSFANGGLIATNENMAIFNKSPGVLLLMIPQILAGNTLFPMFIRLVLWALSEACTGAGEFRHMLKAARGMGYEGLRPKLQTTHLSLTVVGFIAAQVALLCSMNWHSAVFGGLDSFQKFVSSLFMAVNTRHAGENSIDPSLIAPAVLVLYIVMMYFPSSTSFSPVHGDVASSDGSEKKTKEKKPLVEIFFLSQASSVVIFIMVVCIIERRKLSRDPLNFSTLNIIFEVTSAYGNVGLSTGYACSRLQRLEPDAICQDKPYSFSGWWSDEGKLFLVFVMLFGRLKKFSAGGGKSWRLYQGK